jgi:hypothetical protein
MPYTAADLPKHRFPLEWSEPSLEWLNKHVKFWQSKRERWSAEQWNSEVVELFDFCVTNSDNPLGLRSCRICKLSFDSTTWMQMHFETYEHQCQRAEFMGEPKPADPLLCLICDFRAFSHRKMECHKKTYEHVKQVAISEGKPPPTDDRYCKVCDQHLCSVQACRTHFKSNKHRNNVAKLHNETIFVCASCNNQQFASKQSYEIHLKSDKHCIQVGTKTVVTNCTVCDRSYKNRRQYLKHCYTKSHKQKVAAALRVLIV